MSGSAGEPGPTREPTSLAERCEQLVKHLGGHPSAALGIALDAPDALDTADAPDTADERGPGRWLVAACLENAPGGERRLADAWRRLERAGLVDPPALAEADPARVEALLRDAQCRRPDATARLLARATQSLCADHAGSLDRLAGGCEGLEELAGRLAALAPGLGRAAVSRILRPLRERWPAADELPFDAAAHAGAVCLGWLAESDDDPGAPAALRRRLRDARVATPFRDLEAALARLGRRACRRPEAAPCPLGAGCPRAAEAR